jgi:hypothetical protein
MGRSGKSSAKKRKYIEISRAGATIAMCDDLYFYMLVLTCTANKPGLGRFAILTSV